MSQDPTQQGHRLNFQKSPELIWSSPVLIDTFGNKGDDSYMARKRYTEEYKKHLLDLVREGRSPEQLAQEYEPSARTIRNWMREDEVKNLSK